MAKGIYKTFISSRASKTTALLEWPRWHLLFLYSGEGEFCFSWGEYFFAFVLGELEQTCQHKSYVFV